MGKAENIETVRKISSGEVGLLDLWAEDGVWIIPGLATYRGKREIAEKLIDPVTELMASMGRVEVTNIIADGDFVVVEQQAKDRITKTGKPYNNTYCMVYKVVDGKIKQVTEYCDTALAKSVFS
ncbi:MAG: nuclear transport factor 2 family protein [Gammaproteobacteria bacterium]|nr:nuclear transport factor 2 family protein [Gammaproteobacteria bacterium]